MPEHWKECPGCGEIFDERDPDEARFHSEHSDEEE